MKIVIIGNGISGVTAARWVRKLSDHDITIISDESDYFFSRTALMYIYMGHMRLRDTQPYESWFWAKNRINLKKTRVQSIDYQAKTLHTTQGEAIPYDRLVLALGSKSNKFGWPGQDLAGVQGLYHLQDLEAMENAFAPTASPAERANSRAVIIGGGLIGVEMAEMFHSRHIPVTFLVRESDFWNNILPPEESAMITRHLREHHIDLRLETELSTIQADASGTKCAAITTNKGDTIACQFVGLTVGVSPNVDFLKGSGLDINRGILVNEYLETNQECVYAIGDCAELRQPALGRRAIEAVWYTGRMMGETVAYNLLAKANGPSENAAQNNVATPQQRQAYQPGIWFNSAKFFDIEYQVYGDVRAQLPDNQNTLYWEHADGKKSIRLNYDRASGQIRGFNLMGVRYRHEVCEKWIATGAHIETVLQYLGMANFDPEFFDQYESELLRIYHANTGKNLTLKQKRGLSAVLQFLHS